MIHTLRPLRFTLLALLIAAAPIPWARASAPAGHFTDNKDGTVKDNKTGLLWQQAVDPGTYTWDANAGAGSAQAYCKHLPLAGGGWRLPSLKELQTLVDRRVANPAIDSTFFPATPSDWFWTSSPLAYGSSSAWYVNFTYGLTYFDSAVSLNRVRCVR